MAADPGNEAQRDPLQGFIDEVFEEMVREADLSGKTASTFGKDPLAAALLEMATASLSTPSRMSEIERLLFAQSLATALANALAPALANTLAEKITKVLLANSESGSNESARFTSSRPRGGKSGEPEEQNREYPGTSA
ncbi:hypothetical protein AB0A71_42420 [Kitasatospora aureofaciens]|uniref:hypothetical protein n=1 Tax=Kitasatospora aureofaciens TaxID=1894 RepID=UPI0033FE96F5